MIGVALNILDKEFEKMLASNLCRDFDVTISDDVKDGTVYITDYRKEYEGRNNYILLCDNRDMSGDNIIYRYEKIELLKKIIIETYCVINEDYITSIHENDTVLAGAVSSGGGTGCTTVSLGLGQYLAGICEKRVLFLSFDSLPYSWCEQGGKYNINRLMYKASTRTLRKEDMYIYPERDSSGLAYLSYMMPYNRLLDLDECDPADFLSQIISCNAFDYIICDIGIPADRARRRAAMCCDVLIDIINDKKDVWGREKCLEESFFRDYMRKVIKVHNMVTAINESDCIEIASSPESIIVNNGKVTVSMDKGLEDAFKSISEEIKVL